MRIRAMHKENVIKYSDLRRILIAGRFRATTIYTVVMSLWHERYALTSVNQVHSMEYSVFQLQQRRTLGGN